jgi:3,5-epimerase/4-reductase
MKDKILILGEGFIGSRLQEGLDCRICGHRIASFKDADRIIRRFRPQVLVNCIGVTGSDNIENDIRLRDKVLFANSFLPLILAEAALRNNVRLVHISSGCLFEYDYRRDKPVNEEKTPDFLELIYSRTKIYSETPLNILAKKYAILIPRIRLPLDDRPNPNNLLDKLVRYKRVIDIPNSITYIPDFIKALKYLIKIKASGIFNLVNAGALRYSELLDIYAKYVPDFKYEAVSLSKLNLKRTNLRLSTKKLENSGFNIRDINEVLEECVQNYLKY